MRRTPRITRGRNVRVEIRYAQGKLDRLPTVARELAALPMTAIVTGNPYATRAAREASSTIPIVVALDYETDPVASGWIASIARPGGNLTGLFLMAYGPDQPDAYRRAGSHYVGRILQGARPADLPVQRPDKFRLVINGKTAKRLKVAVPQPLMLQADQVLQ
ncbi:MAG TPA: ABC transporter substrate binding protein [Methylomirabilota bacterium]|nr:ABC transporter substrate binding protein [Methylomirabilota bacterium]